MPPFRRWYWGRRQTNRSRRPRRFRFRRRRPRRTLYRRYRTRRRWVRKRKFYKSKRKLKYLKINQWQPKVIRKCHITGYKCLFWAGLNRDSNNYAQYQQSYTHPTQPGGGGWSMIVFSLEALWEEHQLDRNWFTVGNKGLPLVRYQGCNFKFFREEYTDYVVQYTLCYPMIDGKFMHANASPYQMLLHKHRIIVPSKRTKPFGKPYIKKRFRPPGQIFNKWYFSADFCKTGLIMLTTTAVSLSSFYISPYSASNNISIHVLNPKTWQNDGWIHPSETTGYQPKDNLYLYCIPPRQKDTKGKNLTYLGNPGRYTYGTPYADLTSSEQTNYETNKLYWGNPFHPDVLTQSIRVYKSTQQPTAILASANREKDVSTIDNLTLVTEPLILELRYNPDADTGSDTYIYVQSIERPYKKQFPIPEDPNLKITGFPLYLGYWGWLDWQKKLNYIHNVDTSYITVFRSPYTEPKVDYAIPIDQNFLQGKGPYGIPHEDLNSYSLTSWWPKIAHQMVTVNQICNCGPGTAKYEKTKSLQAHCHYKFRFKWGGCPAPMVDLTNPCLQPKYSVPSTIVQRLQVQDPKLPPELELHDFDERHETITQKAIERLKSYTTEQTLSTITGHGNPPTKTKRQRLQEEIEASQEEKEEPTIQLQLNKLQRHQQQLKRALLKLMSENIE